MIAVSDPSTNFVSDGHGIEHDPLGPVGFVVVHPVTGEIIQHIDRPHICHNAIFHPNGAELWVGQRQLEESTIEIYDVATWAITNTITVGGGLAEITFFGDGGSTAFATNTLDGTVTVIDPTTKEIIKTIEVMEDPVGAWVGGTTHMFIDNETSQTMSVLDLATLEITATIDLNFTPGFAAYNPAIGELWVSNADNNQVAYFSEEYEDEWELLGTIDVQEVAHAVGFLPNGNVYVTNQLSNSVSVIDAASHTVIETVPVGSEPNGFTVVIR